MEPSELPPFPTPEPPHPTPVIQSAGRGMFILLQVLFLAAFWPAIYITHEQSAAMIAAEQKIREQEQREQERKAAVEQIAGRWLSTHGDGAILDFVETLFTLRQARSVMPLGWFWTDGHIYLLRMDNGKDYHAQINGDELTVEFREFGQRYFERRGLPWNGVWQFKRLKD